MSKCKGVHGGVEREVVDFYECTGYHNSCFDSLYAKYNILQRYTGSGLQHSRFLQEFTANNKEIERKIAGNITESFSPTLDLA